MTVSYRPCLKLGIKYHAPKNIYLYLNLFFERNEYMYFFYMI